MESINPIELNLWFDDTGDIIEEEEVYTYCDQCDEPIYKYEKYYSSFLKGWIKLHEECLEEYAIQELEFSLVDAE